MSFRVFDYKIKCPFCGRLIEGIIGGELGMDWEIHCGRCGKEVDYDVLVTPLRGNNHKRVRIAKFNKVMKKTVIQDENSKGISH